MLVYKFGGASVNSPDGVRNLSRIVAHAPRPLFVVVSAMGKTTNALEGVVERMVVGDAAGARARMGEISLYHASIIEGLLGPGCRIAAVDGLLTQALSLIEGYAPATGGVDAQQYDTLYDSVVSFGEMLSTTIISEFLARQGNANLLVDMRRCIVTDARHRGAGVLMEQSEQALRRALGPGDGLYIGQGFIGATPQGQTTTLGREGSDYTASVVANLLNASQVVIWKDVPGILNADPRLFPDAQLIPELTYLDAVELAYSGAQVIHPKTIKPLQNKNIPLYVKPFADPEARGSVIRSDMAGSIELPILILKAEQVLVSIRPRDFSFVLEERMLDIFSHFDRLGVKVNLIQTSAINLSLCVDHARGLQEAIQALGEEFRVVYNTDMELLTIRGYTPELYSRYAECDEVFLSQKTRRIVRIVRRKQAAK